ncbi:MAG: uracil-DNA glycosylase [Nitrospinota bacterium]
MTDRIRLDESWKARLKGEFSKEYMINLRAFLAGELKSGRVIYPKGSEYFSALDQTPFEKTKVVLLGQDPYHGPGQAHGLSFSVRPETPFPPSLQNIFREVQDDAGGPFPTSGSLERWAAQGVLLLNSVLTVEKGQAASHQGKGWERFTDKIITILNEEAQGLVFLLWGGYARKKRALIDPKKHKILEAPHPSPLSAHRGFLGCRHFSKTNEYLREQEKTPVFWSTP